MKVNSKKYRIKNSRSKSRNLSRNLSRKKQRHTKRCTKISRKRHNKRNNRKGKGFFKKSIKKDLRESLISKSKSINKKEDNLIETIEMLLDEADKVEILEKQLEMCNDFLNKDNITTLIGALTEASNFQNNFRNKESIKIKKEYDELQKKLMDILEVVF